MRQPLANNAQKSPVSNSVSIPAPISGWNAKDALSDMSPDFAIALDNMFPDLTDIVLLCFTFNRQWIGGCRDFG